ncbi:MAG: hypothetical protein KKH98_02935 [Spirochaetes bacterium]|nr:hypothetical protein [Spirochaetota bacterium]
MDQNEQDLWKKVDVGGYAALGTLFAFILDAIKNKVESDKTDVKEQLDTMNHSYKIISKRFEAIDLGRFDKRFPVDTLRKLKEKLFPEMGNQYKGLNTMLKHYISGSSHLKVRILHKIKECKAVVKQMNELGQEFSKNDRYWEYRKTNPERIYLEGTDKK